MELAKEYILLIIWLIGTGLIITKKEWIELLFGIIITTYSGLEAFNGTTIGIFNGYGEFIVVTFILVGLGTAKIFKTFLR
ncbi:MAG TPA: hypothetical protein VGB37_16370 [Candidatus Lokiarchaeia archaeon]